MDKIKNVDIRVNLYGDCRRHNRNVRGENVKLVRTPKAKEGRGVKGETAKEGMGTDATQHQEGIGLDRMV